MRQSIVLIFASMAVGLFFALALLFGLEGLCVPAAALVSSSADTITDRAVKLMTDNKVDAAVRMERQAVKNAPDYWLPHAALSCMLWRAGDPKSAVAESHKALDLAPSNSVTLFNVAVFHCLLGQYPEAAQDFKGVLKVAPDDWEAGLNYVQCLSFAGKREQAIEALDQMTASDGNSFQWFYEVGCMYYQMNQYSKAQPVLEKALKLAASNEKEKVETALFLAACKNSDLRRAKQVSQDLIGLNTHESSVYTSTARLLTSTPEQGEMLFQAAQKNLGKDAWPMFYLSTAFAAKGQETGSEPSLKSKWLDLALRAINMSILLEPQNISFQFERLAALDQPDHIEALVQALDAMKSIFPQDTISPILKGQIAASTNNVAYEIKTLVNPDLKKAQVPYRLTIQQGDFTIAHASCSCHMRSAENMMQLAPGVLFARIDKTGVTNVHGHVYFDPAQTTFDEVLKVLSRIKEEGQATRTTPVASVHQILEDLVNAQPKPPEPWIGTFHGFEPRMPLVPQK